MLNCATSYLSINLASLRDGEPAVGLGKRLLQGEEEGVVAAVAAELVFLEGREAEKEKRESARNG